MPLKAHELLEQMTAAAKENLEKNWPSIKDLATSELKKLAQNLADIEAMKFAGSISEEQAHLQISIQKNSLRTVLLTEKGLGLIAVESAINAALGVVNTAVNTAIGWKVL